MSSSARVCSGARYGSTSRPACSAGLLIYFGGFLYTAYLAYSAPALRCEVYLTLPWLALAIPIANVSWIFAGAINTMSHPFHAIAVAILVALANAGWSVLTCPALRALAMMFIRKSSAHIGRRIHSPLKARSDA